MILFIGKGKDNTVANSLSKYIKNENCKAAIVFNNENTQNDNSGEQVDMVHGQDSSHGTRG